MPSGLPESSWTPPPERVRLRVFLFLLTALTTWLAGGWGWNGALFAWVLGAIPFSTLIDPGLARDGLVYGPTILAILLAHEMGHYLACRKHGIPATLPMFIPSIPPVGTFGAVIRIRGAIPNRRALLDVAAAGPIAGFLVALPVIFLGIRDATVVSGPPPHGAWLFGDPLLTQGLARLLHGGADLSVGPLYWAGWVGMLVTSMNLFPVGQLDAGHAVYAISPRLHRVISWGTLAVLAVLVPWQAWETGGFPSYAVWLAILLFLRDRHPRLIDETDRLGPGRLAVAGALVLVFALTFMPIPIRFVD